MKIGCFNGNKDCGLTKVIRESAEKGGKISFVRISNPSKRNLPKKVIISPNMCIEKALEQYNSIGKLIKNNPKTKFSIVLNTSHYDNVKGLIGEYKNCEYLNSDKEANKINRLFGL